MVTLTTVVVSTCLQFLSLQLFWKHMKSNLNVVLQEEGVCTAEEITLPEKEWSEYLNKQYEAIDSHPAKVLRTLQVIVI